LCLAFFIIIFSPDRQNLSGYTTGVAGFTITKVPPERNLAGVKLSLGASGLSTIIVTIQHKKVSFFEKSS